MCASISSRIARLISSFDPNDTRFHAGTSTVAPYVVFSPADWNIPFAVQVDANPNAQLPVGQPVQEFVAQPHVTNAIAGPLFIEGGVLPNVDRTLRQPVTLRPKIILRDDPLAPPIRTRRSPM